MSRLSITKTLTLFPLLLALGACKGSSDNGSPHGSGLGGEGGAGSDGTMSGGSSSGGTRPDSPWVHFRTEVEEDVPGFENVLRVTTAFEDEDVEYTWTLLSKPKGSAVDEDDLDGVSTAELRFVPDRGGEYVFEVTVAVAGVGSASSEVTVIPPTYDVPFVLNQVDAEKGSRRVARVVKSGGESVRSIGCPFDVPDRTPQAWVGDAMTELNNGHFVRAWLPNTVNGVARIASTIPREGEVIDVEISSSDTSCDGDQQPVTLSDVGMYPGSMTPRFSRTGHRILIIHPTDGSDLLSLAIDGSSRWTIHTWEGETAGYGVHATWIDATRVAWYDLGSEDIVMYVSQDKEGGGTPESLVDCTGVSDRLLVGHQFQIVGDSIFVLRNPTPAGGKFGAIWRMDPVDGQYFCDAEAESNQLLTDDLRVTEFEVEPSGQHVVLTVRHDDGLHGIYLVPADASAPPTRISPEDEANHETPYWALSGRQLVWTSTLAKNVPVSDDDPTTFRQSVASRLYRANADGSRVTVIYEQTAKGSGGVQVQMGRHSCAFAYLRAAPSVSVLILSLAGLGLMRRRRQHV